MIDIRVSIVPTTFGANIVCRLGNQAANLPLEKIYMPDYVREKYLQVIDSPQGMIIVSGPTGSGKSATLKRLTQLPQYARYQHHDRRRPG